MGALVLVEVAPELIAGIRAVAATIAALIVAKKAGDALKDARAHSEALPAEKPTGCQSCAKSEQSPDSSETDASKQQPPAEAGLPTEDDLKGKTPEEVEKQIPKDWEKTASKQSKGGEGTRYVNPKRPGQQIRVMPGKATDPNPVKQGPYARISTGTSKPSEPIPLAGNPTLPK